MNRKSKIQPKLDIDAIHSAIKKKFKNCKYSVIVLEEDGDEIYTMTNFNKSQMTSVCLEVLEGLLEGNTQDTYIDADNLKTINDA
jgi:hypothetical protein